MARNRFDVDEELESPFNFDNLKKVMVYVVRYKWSMIFALLLSAVGSVVGLTGPLLVQRALDVAIPEKNVPYLVQLALLLTLTIIVNIGFNTIRMVIVAKVGQNIIHDIRKDCLPICRRCRLLIMTTGRTVKFWCVLCIM